MNAKIVKSLYPVVLVGGGPCAADDLKQAITQADCVVAADGGAGHVLGLGHVPDHVIGDMDSLSAQDQAALPPGVLHPIREQDSTDFDKALRNISAPQVWAYGFCGGRLDHQLAVLNVLVRRADQCCVLVGDEDLTVLAPRHVILDLPVGSRLSLFPMTGVSGRSEGLRWPIKGLDFAPDGQSGTSNEVTGPVDLRFDIPGMLLILPRDSEAALRDGLSRAIGWA